MRKIIIIVMAVLLGNGICIAQNQDTLPNPLSESNQVVKKDTILTSPAKNIISATNESSIQRTTEVEQSNSEQILFLIISVIVLVLLVIGLFVFVFLDRRKHREMVIDIITNNNNYVEGHRLKQWLDDTIITPVENIMNKPTNQNLQPKIKDEIESLRDRIEDLDDRLIKIEKRPVDRPAQPSTVINSPISHSLHREIPAQAEQKKLYAMNIIDGFFNRVSKQILGTPIFELTLTSSNSASFTVYKNAYKRVLASPEILEGCDKQTLSDTPHDLQIVEGKASLQSDGKWKIDQKASVRLVLGI